MITPDDIRWLPPTAAKVDGKHCPVCGRDSGHTPLLTVPSLTPSAIVLTLLRCGGCVSVFYDPPDIRDFSDLGQDREDFWRIYAESFCGVWEMIWPILATGAPTGKTLLDVGCGMGFALDFWRSAKGGEAVGVEVSEYGAVGSELLEVTIHKEPLQECTPLAGRRFDVVYASEVIEHVPDPTAFAAMLAGRVKDSGVLVMTTPCAAFVVPLNHSTTLLAALAPGFHGFLISPEAFGDIARKAGFAHVDVRVFGERQILWASHVPRTINHDSAELRGPYFDYLTARLASNEVSSSLWQGLAYRCVRDLAGTGRFAEAKSLATRLMLALEQRYGSIIARPAEIAAQLSRCESLTEAGEVAPYFIPCLYYHLGNIAQNADGNRRRALEMLSGSVEVTLACVRLGLIFYLEAISLLWPARVAAAILHLAGTSASAGTRILARLADEGRTLSATNGYAIASTYYIESTLMSVCEGLSMRGQTVEADAVFDSYLRYVEYHYGSPVLTESGIDEALRRSSVPLPREPLYALWFEGQRSQRISPIGSAASAPHAQLAAVVRLGETFAGDPRIGTLAPDLASRARKMLGMPTAATGRVVLDFSYKFRPPAS
ncbi:MAG TPA: class I SAM-dependent methyltransferase [Casimicrobiaceae bacterium]|jgi:SAM-dependent methyltransferase